MLLNNLHDQAVQEIHHLPLSISTGLLCTTAPDLLSDMISKVRENETVVWITQGLISMHHIIELLVGMAGDGCVLHFTTWTISEDAARALYSMKERGNIAEIHAIIDHRILSGAAPLYHFIHSFFEHLQLEACHAKMVLITGRETTYAVFSSANMNQNNRIENTIVTQSPNTVNPLRQWFENKLHEADTRSTEPDRRNGLADDDAPSDSHSS
jgi:hypothetical protein